jgi:hypothetical protein
MIRNMTRQYAFLKFLMIYVPVGDNCKIYISASLGLKDQSLQGGCLNWVQNTGGKPEFGEGEKS